MRKSYIRRLQEEQRNKMKSWAYGVTTIVTRLETTLPRTLKSLELAGFPNPKLFIDGELNELPESLKKYKYTIRGEITRTFCNWILTAWELLAVNPHVDYYAIFQDDFVTYKDLRIYLERCTFPQRGYWNLYTFPINVKNEEQGWYLSKQNGKGAVALIFNNEGLRSLLCSRHMVDRVQNKRRAWKSVDGAIITALRHAGWKEYVHNPSLTQHIGKESSMGNKPQPDSPIFKGEDFDIYTIQPS
jgi:hypothetical protein